MYYNYNLSSDAISKSKSDELLKDMLEEYPWLTMDDFVTIVNYLDWWPDTVMSIDELLNKVSRLSLHDRIVKNLGESELETFVLMMVLAYGNYKILKVTLGPDYHNYFIGLTEEDIKHHLNTYMTIEDRKTYRKKFIEI